MESSEEAPELPRRGLGVRVGDARRPSPGCRERIALGAWRRCRVRASSSPGRSGGMCGARRRPTEGSNPNLTAAPAPGFALLPRSLSSGSVGWRAAPGFPRACPRLFFLLGYLALWLFCRAEGSGEESSSWLEFS